MALAHLLMIGAKDKGNMAEFRYRIAQCFINGKLTGSVGQVFFGTDNVGHAHEGIIDHHGKVVHRNAIGFDNNEIAYAGCLEFHMASHHIVKGKDAVFSYFEADNRFSAFCCVLSNLIFRQVAAVVLIHRCMSCSHLLLAAFIPIFIGEETVVGLSFLK